MPAEVKDNLPILPFAKPEEFAAWIEEHVDGPGLWLKIAKKGSGVTTVDYAQALDVALCWGWIDGQKGAYDSTYFVQRFTPRRAKSVWSKINVEKIAALTAAGRMQPSGVAVVAAAKADGRWEAAYDGARTMEVPPDFAAALEANPKAKAFWGTLNKTNTYAFNYRIQSAKKPETRVARIEKFIELLNDGKPIH